MKVDMPKKAPTPGVIRRPYLAHHAEWGLCLVGVAKIITGLQKPTDWAGGWNEVPKGKVGPRGEVPGYVPVEGSVTLTNEWDLP